MRRRLVSSLFSIAVACAAGCSEDRGPGTGTADATARLDAAPRLDAAVADGSSTPTDAEPVTDGGPAPTDAEPVTDADFDAGPAPTDAEAVTDADFDAGPAPTDAETALDAGPAPTDASAPHDGGSACDFLDLEIAIVRCGNAFGYLRGWQDVSGTANCLPYWTLEGGTFTSSTAAIAGASCSDQCYYRAHMSVSFIDHCNRRNGYIVFRDEPNQAVCPDVYEFSNGLFPSRAAWEQDTPCGP